MAERLETQTQNSKLRFARALLTESLNFEKNPYMREG